MHSRPHDGIRAGKDFSARVSGVILDNVRGPKIIVFKFKRKKQVRRTIGHRQHYTEIEITGISA